MSHHAIIPHPEFKTFLFSFLLLIGLPLVLFAQSKKPSRGELNKIRIDSIFNDAEKNGLGTQQVLRYEFLFSDPDKKRFADFSARMKKDSFESGALRSYDNSWKMSLVKNSTYSRSEMYELEKKLRWIKYQYYIDDYLGFTIAPADPDPLAVPDAEFTAYLNSLPDSQLFWVGKRLLDIANYEKAIQALKICAARKFKPDTTAYHYGLALVAVHEPNDGINQWKKAINQNPEYLVVFIALGNIHFENGYFKEALAYYQQADSLQPNDSQLLLHIGETLYALERYNQSYDYAMRSYNLDRRNIFTRSLIRLLKEPRIKYLRKKYPDQ